VSPFVDTMALLRLCIALWLGAAACSAATMFYLPDAKLCEISPVIVVGDITAVHGERVPGSNHVQTRAALTVVEYVKAPTPALPEIEIVTAGGVAGGIETRRPGAPRFVKGERVLVFLAPQPDGYGVVGLARGKYHVQVDGDAPATVRLDLDGLTQLDPESGREIPADLIPASAGRVYLDDLVATLRRIVIAR
jgi:hypothetical protein